MSQPWDISIAQGAEGPVRLAGKATGEPSGGSQTVLSATLTLTDAQIKTLPSAGVTLVAAQGAGKIIVPIAAVLVAQFAAGNYSGGAGDYYTIGTLTDQAELMTPLPLTGLTDAKFATMSPFLSIDGSTIQPSSNQDVGHSDNAALTISGSASGNWTGGGVGNTLGITVAYMVVTV